MSEDNEVVRPAREMIEQRGGKSLKVQPVPRSGVETGTPDIIGCYRGVFLAIEAKAPGGRPPRATQLARVSEWLEAGGVAFVTEDPGDVEAALDAIDLAAPELELTVARALRAAENNERREEDG